MSSAMAGQPQQSKPQPGELDQPRDQTPQQQEKTPEAPGKDEEQSQPEPEEDRQGKDEEKPGEGQPESPQKDDSLGRNDEDSPPDEEKGTPVAASIDADRWGELPARVRATFRNQGKDDLPVQYREWIDAYYRRLSRQR